MNTKKNRILFVNKCREIIKESGAEFTGEIDIYYPSEVYSIKNENNKLDIRLYLEQDHKNIYSIFMCFETPNNKCQNIFSGKHNFHDGRENVEDVIESFKIFLKGAISILDLSVK